MCNNKLTVFEPNGMEMLTTYNSDIVIIEALRKLLSKLREYRSNCNLIEVTEYDVNRSMHFVTSLNQISAVLSDIDEAAMYFGRALQGNSGCHNGLRSAVDGFNAVYNHHYKILTKNK
jgi:hypothetical protein